MARLDLLDCPITIIDFETTGLSADNDRVVEAAALRIEPGVDQWPLYCTLVDPQRPIPPELTAVHGITDAMVAGKPTFDYVCQHIVDIAKGSTLVAHNLKFDRGFLNAGLRRLGLPAWLGPTFDTVALARKVWPGLLKHKLEFLVDHLKIDRDVGGNHRAGADVVFTARLMFKAAAVMEGRDPPRT